jgi:uncharacterized protein involved in outer membrane biogenesis
LRKAFGFLAVLLVVAVAALLVAPAFIDWNRWKPEIAAQLAAATGRAVTIEGPIGFQLLPYPEASAKGLRIATRAAPRSPDLVRVGALEIRLDLGALLSGRIVASSLRLVEPVVELPLPERPQGASGQGGAIGIDRLAVERGTILWRHGGATERIDQIDLVASVDSLEGPFRAKGSARWRNATLRFDGEAGRLDAARVPLSLPLDAGPAGRIETHADLADGAATGRLALAGQDLGQLLALAGASAPWAAGRKYALSGPVTASRDRITVENATVSLDEARGTGALDVKLGAAPSIEARLALPSLDLDRFAGLATGGVGASFARPANLTAHLAASADIVRLRGEILRQARLDLALAQGTLQVTRAAAQLPGGADFSLAGTLAAENGAPRFAGSVELSADNLRELLAWLGARLPGLPADRLRRASLTSRFTARPDRIDIAALDLSLDATRLTGAAIVVLRDRIGIGARLALDRLVLDPYLGAFQGAGGDAFPVDLNLEASADQLVWRGQSLAGVKLAAVLQRGRLTLREASVKDLAGATVSLSGEAAGGKLRGAIEAEGPELARLLRLRWPSWTRPIGAFRLAGNAEGDLAALTVDAKLDALGGEASARGTVGLGGAGDLAVDARHPSLKGLLAALGYRSAGEPGAFSAKLRLAGDGAKWRADDVAIEAGPAHLAGKATLDASGAKPRIEAQLDATGELALDPYLPVRQSASLAVIPVQARVPAPAAPDPWSREPLDLGFLAGFGGSAALTAEAVRWGTWRLEGARARLEVADGALAVKQLDGKTLGGEVSGEARLGQRFEAKLALRDADIAAMGAGDRIAGKAALDLDVTASGQSPYELVSRLAGTARLSARDGRIGGIDLRAVSDRLHQIDRITDLLGLVRSAAGGTTPFSTLDGTFRIERGVARSDDLKLVAEAGEATATAALDLPSWTMESLVSFRLTDHPDAPALGMMLEGPIDAPRRSFDTRALQQYFATRGIERLLRELPR